MFSIVKSWKEYRVYLPSLSLWLQSNIGATFSGLSADYSLTLWFLSEPSEQQKSDIDSQWDALSEIGEAAKWLLYDQRLAAVEDARVGLLTAAFDDLGPSERKLLLGLSLSEEDLDALLLKFPQA